MRGLTSSYATASIAFRVTWPHKPHHSVRVGILSGDCLPLQIGRGSWNVMAHVQKPDFVFRRNGRVHLNRRGLQFSRLPAAEVCASAVVMLDTPCSEVVWRVLPAHSIRQFPLQFPCVTVCHHISIGVYSASPLEPFK
jgi:hypothetical protein